MHRNEAVFLDESMASSSPFITRTVLPSKRIPKNEQSVWSILKNGIGKDFSRLTMPIVFNEPLSFIQRLAEYMENIHLLRQAASSTDPIERMEYIGAFAVSTLSSQRLSKPFNPLLFETYELERKEMGFRFVAEQVSHHPPISVFHASDFRGEFEFYGNVAPKLRFWGRSLEIVPNAHFTVHLSKWNETYTWNAVNISVYNIILGQLYMVLNGTLVVKCHASKSDFRLNFKDSGLKASPEFLASGEILINKEKVRGIYGNFSQYIASVSPTIFAANFERFQKMFREFAVNNAGSTDIVLIRNSKVLWRKFALPPNCEDYYDFSYLTLQLNELTKEESLKLPRTDSRFRPDIREMEKGNYDEAANYKKQLEEKQRVATKKNPHRTPKWFNKQLTKDEFGREHQWRFNNAYWNRHFDDCEEIY